MFFDYKSRHKSNWPERADQHPSVWESIVGGLLIGVVGTGIILHAFIMATGGY